MKPEEACVEKFLRKNYGKNVIFEPDGNIPPDFAVNSYVAVEVRRLNQHFVDGERTEGLEQLSFRLLEALKEVLSSFDSQFEGKSYWLFIDYERPLNKKMREIKAEIHTALQNFLCASLSLPYTLRINDNIVFWLDASSSVNGRIFRLGGETDGDAGGWVISEYIENIRYCIAQKSSKISQYKSRYKEWWLYLVDYMALGLDQSDIKEVTSAISNLGEFDKVDIITHNGEYLLIDMSRKYEK